jgi:hypothetical protein
MLLVSTIFEIRYEAMVRSDGRVENSDNRTLPVTLLYFIAVAEIILWESTDNLCWLCRFKVPMMIVWPRARLSSLSLPLDMVTQHVDRDDQGRSTPRRVVCPFTSHTCSTNSALALLLNHSRTVYSPPLHRPPTKRPSVSGYRFYNMVTVARSWRCETLRLLEAIDSVMELMDPPA